MFFFKNYFLMFSTLTITYRVHFCRALTSKLLFPGWTCGPAIRFDDWYVGNSNLRKPLEGPRPFPDSTAALLLFWLKCVHWMRHVRNRKARRRRSLFISHISFHMLIPPASSAREYVVFKTQGPTYSWKGASHISFITFVVMQVGCIQRLYLREKFRKSVNFIHDAY